MPTILETPTVACIGPSPPLTSWLFPLCSEGPKNRVLASCGYPEAQVVQRTWDCLEALHHGLCLGACPELPFPNKFHDGQEEHFWGNYQFK